MLGPTDIHISYLPMAHMMERCMQVKGSPTLNLLRAHGNKFCYRLPCFQLEDRLGFIKEISRRL